jgi:hypothetical protein
MSSAVSVPDFYRIGADELCARHGGNTGNVAFVSAIRSHLTGNVIQVDWGTSAGQLRACADLVIIACANQLGRHTDLSSIADNLDQAGLPIIAIGLGAQADTQGSDVVLTEGTRRWVEVIRAHQPTKTPNIGVRGEYTLRQLDRLGLGETAAVTGCPSNFTNLATDYVASIERQVDREVTYVAIAAGHPHTQALMTVDRQLVALVDQCNGTCIVQHDHTMIKAAMQEFDAIKPSSLEHTRQYFKPELAMPEFQEWCRRRLLVFADTTNWMAWLRRYDFVLGPRFHGIMLALQAGVPAGCIAHDSRTLELYETMAVPVRTYDSISEPLSLENIRDVFPFDGDRYRAVRRALGKTYVSMLQAANVGFDPKLMEI